MAKPIVLTAGHSDIDPGAVGHGQTEAGIARELRNIVASKLRGMGERVITDGEPASNKPLRDAIALIPQGRVAVEIHCNAAANPAAGGVECISLPQDKALSQRLSRAVARVLELRVRGDGGWIDQSQSARGRLGYVNAGGLILEVFFISNPAEMAVYQARKWLVAQAIADVLQEVA